MNSDCNKYMIKMNGLYFNHLSAISELKINDNDLLSDNTFTFSSSFTNSVLDGLVAVFGVKVFLTFIGRPDRLMFAFTN